ncbi:single-stranded DNA-binding protein [Paramicrobacterium agarici]|uniref:single-stranded DNA-binding protein n=1 Tax=Paramicrobacterium agarici TaxID=630514 RepID=UPI001151E301|nr:single-stranded DNA-binding protein [Microbacterium agarici]TQO24198.1 single-strand DNA-binding protein [Microbacterium agarici]
MADTITVTGVVGTVPQLGDAAGTPVCNFRLASSLRRYDKQSGKWTEYGTNWYSVGAYRYLGKNVAASVNKGDRVVVTGRVRLREWSNQTASGMTVDIDATSVGHDLTWGTTTYRKHNQAEADHADADQAEDAREDGDGFLPDAPETPDVPGAPLVETAPGASAESWSTVPPGHGREEAA